MASSGDDSRCALGAHPHTLYCLSVGVIVAGHCCERDGDTTAPPLEKVTRSVGCGAVRRFACSPTDRTAQSFHCCHSVGITRCGGVRKSRSPDEDGLVVIWQLRTSGPSPFRIALAARLAQHQPYMALLHECRHQSAPATRLVGCTDIHQACSGRAGGVVILVRHTLPCERLSLLAPTAWRQPSSACAHRPAPACTW
ncbi:exo-alpha-sialidase [Trypanosoma cruzi]|nr:exo-alpha-sialidase [Trypanosoma cruzi]